ncbi:MAG: type II methionyl aminopeptidase [Candidatus Bathyarchaeia archaeon]
MINSIDKYKQAGRIARRALREIGGLVRANAKVLDICERIESIIIEGGGKPAFPCNVCINDVAAHYTSPPNDDATIPPRSVVKVDLGVHVEGCIVDTARTVALDPSFAEQVKVAEGALTSGIEEVRDGVSISSVSRAIQGHIEEAGYKPIWNLTGHKIDRYVLHTGKSIPNVVRHSAGKLRSGEIYAIEPFVTEIHGKGEVTHTGEAYIFRFDKARSTKNREERELADWIRNNFRGLPFTKRWLPPDRRDALPGLLSRKIIRPYPVLIEAGGGKVTQAEQTIVVTKDGCLVLT